MTANATSSWSGSPRARSWLAAADAGGNAPHAGRPQGVFAALLLDDKVCCRLRVAERGRIKTNPFPSDQGLSCSAIAAPFWRRAVGWGDPCLSPVFPCFPDLQLAYRNPYTKAGPNLREVNRS